MSKMCETYLCCEERPGLSSDGGVCPQHQSWLCRQPPRANLVLQCAQHCTTVLVLAANHHVLQAMSNMCLHSPLEGVMHKGPLPGSHPPIPCACEQA